MFQSPIVAADASPFTPAAFRQRMNADSRGDYARFRKLLTPRYGRIAIDIALGYASLAGTLAAVSLAGGAVAGLAAACIGAVAVGFFVAFLQLFIHEGAHFNLAADRRTNDRIADWLICWQVGTSIAAYRATHGAHHRYLGHARDTEVSYRHALTPGFVIEMLTGIHAVRVFLSRGTEDAGAGDAPAPSRLPLLRGVALHLLLVAGLLAAGAWPAALAWIGGIGVVFPLFATLRQMAEHRPTDGLIDEGDAVTRLFDDGVFARLFGGAGFNRHLLHHLEPQVSYTRLLDLERFVMTTSLGAELDARRTTYGATFLDLMREGSARG